MRTPPTTCSRFAVRQAAAHHEVVDVVFAVHGADAGLGEHQGVAAQVVQLCCLQMHNANMFNLATACCMQGHDCGGKMLKPRSRSHHTFESSRSR